MGKIIAVANQKGGVGKTTTAVNLAAALGTAGHKTLLIDIDPQGNATSGMGINKSQTKRTAYDVLSGLCGIEDCIIKTGMQNLSIVPAAIELVGAEVELVAIDDRALRLKKAVLPVKSQYDYIIIDCPPALGLITLNCFTAADTILVPIQCEFYALEGLSQLVDTIRQVRKTLNPTLDIEGVLLTMYDGRLKLTMQVVDQIRKIFPRKVFKTVIPRNVRISEAPSFGLPIAYYDHRSVGAAAYDMLAKELADNNS